MVKYTEKRYHYLDKLFEIDLKGFSISNLNFLYDKILIESSDILLLTYNPNKQHTVIYDLKNRKFLTEDDLYFIIDTITTTTKSKN